MFVIAGPVIVYGTLASVIYGILYYIFAVSYTIEVKTKWIVT